MVVVECSYASHREESITNEHWLSRPLQCNGFGLYISNGDASNHKPKVSVSALTVITIAEGGPWDGVLPYPQLGEVIQADDRVVYTAAGGWAAMVCQGRDPEDSINSHAIPSGDQHY